eukprot:SAG31_NODE_10211_length_1170_cov_1.231559_1_plen_259_part_00
MGSACGYRRRARAAPRSLARSRARTRDCMDVLVRYAAARGRSRGRRGHRPAIENPRHPVSFVPLLLLYTPARVFALRLLSLQHGSHSTATQYEDILRHGSPRPRRRHMRSCKRGGNHDLFATDENTYSVEMGAVCLLFPGGSGARAGPPSDTGYDSSLYMLQADFLDTTNLTGGAAAATAPGSPHNDLYSDLLRGSGDENKIGTPPFVGALGCAPAQSFPNRCSSALRAGGGCSGGGGSFSRSPPMIAASTCDCKYIL